MRGQSIHIKRERDTYGVRAAQLGKRMVKVFPAPQRNRFFDKAGKKQPEDTGEKLRSAAGLRCTVCLIWCWISMALENGGKGLPEISPQHFSIFQVTLLAYMSGFSRMDGMEM